MEKRLRVMSANLWAGAADPDGLADLVSALGVDVLAVQELGEAQARAIQDVLPHGVVEPDTAHHGMGIVLRRPAKLERWSLTFRDAHVARLDPSDWPELGAPIDVVNVHMAAPHVAPWGSGFHRRRQQLRQLERHLIDRPEERDAEQRRAAEGEGAAPQQAARILVGDFNATPVWPLYRRVALQLTDAAIAVAQRRGRPARPTWGPWAGAPRMLRIDHGFVAGLEVDEFQVVDIPGSDHSAIVLDVIPPGAPRAEGMVA